MNKVTRLFFILHWLHLLWEEFFFCVCLYINCEHSLKI